jgi:hypothetical protein
VRVPELPILDKTGKLHKITRDILWTIMVYPDDPNRQAELRSC